MRNLLAAVLATGLLACPALAADRIVTVGSDVTEIVFALGRGDSVVASDATSTYPAAAEALPKVGYLRTLSAEGVLAQNPQVLIAAAGAGPAEVLTQIEGAGVRVVRVPDADTPDGVMQKIGVIGDAIGAGREATTLAADFEARLTAARAKVSEAGGKPRVLALLATGQGGLMAGGTATAADSMITLAGGENVFAAAEGYKPLSPEAAAAANPDVILVPSHVLGIAGGRDAIRSNPALALTAAARDDRIVVVDSLLFLGFGPRLPEGVEAVAAAIRRPPS